MRRPDYRLAAGGVKESWPPASSPSGPLDTAPRPSGFGVPLPWYTSRGPSWPTKGNRDPHEQPTPPRAGPAAGTYAGTADYIAAPDLMQTVNVAVQLGRPLLIKGEPGTGKTMLAQSIARGLDMPLIVWNIKSTTKAQDGLYVYDTVQRLYDGQFGDRDVADIAHYIKLGKLGEAFRSTQRVVLLIDEIDKADLEFPNDLLWELDQMEFYIPETHETVSRGTGPIVLITSQRREGAARRLPAALRLPLIEFPDADDDGAHRARARARPRRAPARPRRAGLLLAARRARPAEEAVAPASSSTGCRRWRAAASTTGDIAARLPFMGVLLKKDHDVAAHALSAAAAALIAHGDARTWHGRHRRHAPRHRHRPAATRAPEPRPVFTDFFFLLRAYGVPVTVTEWLALMRALALGLAPAGLDQFYARGAQHPRQVARPTSTSTTRPSRPCSRASRRRSEIEDEVWDWLADPLAHAGPERRGAAPAGRAPGGPRPGGARSGSSRSASPSRPRPTTAAATGSAPAALSLRPLRLPPRRHPRRRREPRPQRRQGGRRAPLPRLPHRPGGRRAPVRAGAAPPAPAQHRATRALPDELDLDETVERDGRPTPAASASCGARAARTPSRCCCSWTWAAPCTPTSASAASSSAP